MAEDKTLQRIETRTRITSGLSLDVPSTAEERNFLPMLHGKATDTLALMAGEKVTQNEINKTGILKSGEVKLVIDKFNELSGTLGVSTHKLLSTAVAKFTEINHTGTSTREARYTSVNIPLREYALHCGYDVMEHPTETPEQAEREAKRAENALKNARKKINKDLAVMFASSLSWSEKVKGKLGDYIDIRLIEAKGISNGFIRIRFSQTFSEYLVKLPLTQYPLALLGVDERNNNAYNMGFKMAEHFNLDNNQIRGTAQLLKVKTLLEYTSLPSIGSIRKQRTSWEARIKEPFETALDALTACQLLEDWRYSKSKGEELTDEEATSFFNYEEWEETLVHFTLKDAPDHTARLEARAEERETRQAKKKTTKKEAKVKKRA